MFAEAQELPADSRLAERLYDYCTTLVRGRRGRLHRDDSYEIRPDSDAPVLRRLATLMDAQALALGPWSGVGRALAGWASRIGVAVAEAQVREAILAGPSPELVAMAEALGFNVDEPLESWLTQACDAIAARPAPSDGGRAELAEHVMRTGRVWTRREGLDRSTARRARSR
jgi:hypothetical protein